MKKHFLTAAFLVTIGGAAALASIAAQQPSTAGEIEWELKTLDTAPESRIATALAMFASGSEMILFGGSYNRKAYNDTWSWNGHKWIEKNPLHRPPARNSHTMAYDPVRNEIVLFGGFESGKFSNSTWIWNGSDWRQAQPANKPQYAINGTMAFNYATGRVMLFGGIQNDNSVWEWDGHEWTKIPSPSGPPPRSYAGLAFDTQRNEMIMFGGITNPSEATPRIYNDTWAWNGKTWRQIPVPVSPSARYHHKMEYHPGIGKIILVGGRKGKRDMGPGPEGIFSDTWSWDGQTWQQHKSKKGIQPAYSYGMGLNSTTNEFHVYLGDSLLCATRGPKIFIMRQAP